MYHKREQHEQRATPFAGYMENYTTPFLVSFGVVIFMALTAIWVVMGLPFTVVLALMTARFLLRS